MHDFLMQAAEAVNCKVDGDEGGGKEERKEERE